MGRTSAAPSSRILARSFVAAAMVVLGLLAAGCGVFGDDEKPVIRLYAGAWRALSVNHAIARFVIERGYGYPVETVVLTTFVMQEALPSGEVDVNMEGWQQNIPDWYEEQIANGAIVNLGTTYEDSSQFFLRPSGTAEQ